MLFRCYEVLLSGDPPPSANIATIVFVPKTSPRIESIQLTSLWCPPSHFV